MPEAPMALSERQLQQVGRYVQSNLPAWLRTVPAQVPQATDPMLLERMVRVEEELKAQREIMIERFEDMNTRFTHTQWLAGVLVTMFMGLSTALQLL